MSDREPLSGLMVWIALQRSHEGGVSNLAGRCWLDSGHRVPGYVAEALDELTRAGMLTLGEVEPKACGVRRATVTDTGCAYYVAMCQIHHRTGPAAVGTPHRWAHSPRDQRSHLLTVPGTDQIGTLIGVCGHRMLRSVPTSAHPAERPCPTCQALPTMPVPGPQYQQPLLRWARCPDDGRLHLLQPVAVATTEGHAQALCGHRLPPEGLTITSSAGALCLTCIAGIVPHQQRPHEGLRPLGRAAPGDHTRVEEAGGQADAHS